MPDQAFQNRAVAGRELGVRIASALVLAVATLALTASGRIPFALLVAAVAAALIWEWGRLVRRTNLDTMTIVGLLGMCLAIGLATAGWSWIAGAVVGATAVASLVLGGSRDGVASALGPIYAGVPSLALIIFHASVPAGELVVVFLLLVVWSTDTGAFIAGRALGGPKLWVAVSPKKTWTGLLGGTISGALVAFAFANWVESPIPGRVAVLGAGLAIASQLGDLCESALKRAYGVKDTSHLIPGHGGFMDRVDSLVFAVLAAGLWWLLYTPDPPATALLGLR